MCKWCMRHGAGGKWYLNARNYSNELAESMNLQAYLEEQWKNFEQVYIRKIMGISSIDLGNKLKMPIIGRILRWSVERMIHSESLNRNPVRADGHFGQVIPIEEAKLIMMNLAAEPIIKNYCMCRMMQKGLKDACCINFGLLSSVIEKLPRFIPENSKLHITREEAVEALKEQNLKGRIATVWFQPVPYINAICSCEVPQCGGLRLRMDFGLYTVYKAEYVAEVNSDLCQGCRSCISRCQFNALRYSPTLERVIIDPIKCFGCGLCRDVCPQKAIILTPREEHPGLKGKY
ncbi:MAG: 4Fe-4S binding protein [Nitrososphaerota archaeon]|nr:4Fe-4S binding protein [Candidatus Bathyarchaeota archaeon]MDW8194493.1 4Fe-4S binding protein [Nitrososphaerota archaeon]